jgi:DNA helicase-2/ATP-dependent DNA helicase PcrA
MEQSKESIHLTATQQAIVDSPSKRLLVLSCAGSGKTRVIVERIARLLKEGVKPSSILALTFSSRASQEMKNRLNDETIVGGAKVGVKTFHAFGFEIIRHFSKEIGFDKCPSIADPTETDSLLKTVLDRQKISPAYSSGIKSYFQQKKAFSENSDPNEDSLFASYQKGLRLKCLLDLDDLIYLPTLLLTKDLSCRRIVQDEYRYLFVDEYQDTSEAQNRFLGLLLGPETSLCLVGDDDQAIYEWRGAKPGYIREKAKSGEFDCFYLTENFRSGKAICEAANEIIGHNQTRVIKRIVPHLESNVKPTYHRAVSEEDEAAFVAKEIQRLLESGKFSPSDIAVLYRNNYQQGVVKEALNSLSIPAESLDVDENFKYSRFVKVLKSIVDFHSSRDLSEALNFPDRFFDQMAFTEAKDAYLKATGKSLPDDAMAALSILYSSEVSFPDADLFRHRYGYIHQLHYANDFSSSEIIAFLISDFEAMGYDGAFPKEYSYLKQVFAMAKTYEESYGKSKLADFVNDLLITLGNNDETFDGNGDSVALLTMHRAKGLEWKAVFIIGVQVGIIPNDYYVHTDESLEAERRLFYVALTRAKDLLYLSSYRDPFGAPPDSFVRCGFLAEMPSVCYTREPLADKVLAQLPKVEKTPVKVVSSDAAAEALAKKNAEPLAEKGLFEIGLSVAMDDAQLARYQNECLALSQQIEISPRSTLVVIGALDLKKDVFYGICKSNGFKKEQIEYHDYQDSKLNFRRYANNANYLGIILGPNAHSQVGGFDLLSILSQDGFPLVINLIQKHITKSSLQNAIIKIKLASQKDANV